MANETEVKSVVRKKREGSIVACYGPIGFGNDEVWELWVHHEDEYKTRYVIDRGQQELLYFGDFQQVYRHAERMIGEKEAIISEREEEIRRLKETKHQDFLKLYVAATVFIASFAILLYLVFAQVAPNVLTFSVLASLIASGSVMFFGAWKTVGFANSDQEP